jgi:hypothetical protein
MKKVIFAVVATLLISTSAFASGFCEVPDVLEKGNAYQIVMSTGKTANITVLKIDDDACWVKAEDRDRRIATDTAVEPMYLSIREMVAIYPHKK